MSNIFAITIPIKPSRKAIVFFISLYCLAILAILLTGITTFIKLLLITGIALQAYYTLTYFVFFLQSKAIKSIETHDAKSTEWVLIDKNDEVKKVALISCTALSPWLILLRFLDKKNKLQTYFILSDNTTKNAFHHLLLIRYIF